MGSTPEDLAAQQAAGDTNLRPLRIIPGGASAIPEEWYAAGIMLGALAGLWLIRKNLGTEGRTMASGTAAIVFVFYYLIVTAIVRIVAANLAGQGDTSLARGFAFYA